MKVEMRGHESRPVEARCERKHAERCGAWYGERRDARGRKHVG